MRCGTVGEDNGCAVCYGQDWREQKYWMREISHSCLKCKEGWYLDGIVCKKCHPDCKTCKLGPMEHQCCTCQDDTTAVWRLRSDYSVAFSTCTTCNRIGFWLYQSDPDNDNDKALGIQWR